MLAPLVRRLLGPDWLLGWTLLLPTIAILLSLVAYPLISAVLLSFEQRFLGASGSWVGLANYVALFERQSLFLRAAFNTSIYTISAIALKLVLGLAMAAVLNHQLVWQSLWRGVLFLPWAVPAIVAAFVWRFLYADTGPFNSLLQASGRTEELVYFLSDARYAMPAVVIVAVWSGTPFWTMNLLAGMQAISSEIYEAAEMDGAGTWHRFWHITLPSLRHVMLITGLLSVIWTSSSVAHIYVLTSGGPLHTTTTLPFLAYEVAIPGKQLGMGAAIAMLMVPPYLGLMFLLTRGMLAQEQ